MGKIDEQISYNWLFFFFAGAFGFVTFWAVWDETATRREYKDYQEAFFKIETDLADKQLKGARAKLDADAEYKKLVAEKKQIEGDLAGAKKGAFEDAKQKLQEAEFTAFDKQQNFTFTKSLMDESYYYFTKARHEAKGNENDPELKERANKLHAYEDQLRKDEAAMTSAAKARDDLKSKVDGFTSRLGEIGKQIEKLESDVKESERKYAAAAEKQGGMFGPATEIQQQNIEEIGRVDRCESCHLGANRGGFETVQPAYYRSHPYRRTLFALHPVEKFGCTSCHDGQGRATTKFYAHAPTDNPHYAEKHFWEEPLLRGAMQEANCRKCHTEEYELRSQIRCESDTECPSVGEKGKQTKLKCDVPSQPLNPSDTSVAMLSVWPPKGEETKYCVNPENNVAELVDLSPHLTRGRRIIEEVGCYGCHPIEGYEKKPKPAPDLRHAKDKLTPGWIVEWIKNPKAFHPKTRMPNFFPEELAPGEYPKTALPTREDKSKNPAEPWKWTVEQQTTALTSFLLAQSTPYTMADKLPLAGDAARGKELVLSLGCRGCHNVTEDEKDPAFIDHKNRASHYDHGPNLGNVGSKTNAVWLYHWLKDPKSYAPETRMPNLRLSDQEAADVATYLAGSKDKRDFSAAVAGVNADDKAWVEDGKKLMNYYGCYGCHLINGYETTAGIGAELTEFGLKEVSRLDYGDYIVNHKQQTWEAWLENKLKHPRVYRYERVDTRMPQFDLTPEEIEDVMVVMKGMRGKTLEAQVRGHKLSPREAERERGRELMRWYNCYGCHIVDGHVGDIRQAKEYQGDAATFAPPNISGEGAKTQPPWLFSFFKNVVRLRPWLSVRMPTFGFDDAQATSLVSMFSALDHAQYPYPYYDVKLEGARKLSASAMFTSLKCTSCHVVGDVKLTPEEAQKAAPNLLLAKHRLRPEWIVKWLSNPEAIQPGTRMPSFFAGGANLLQGLMQTPDGKKTFGGLPGIEQIADSAVHQMEAIRDFVFTLEAGGAASNTTAPKAKKASAPGRKRAAAPAPHSTLN
jgi:mono/diheme cytochrome c family protein